MKPITHLSQVVSRSWTRHITHLSQVVSRSWQRPITHLSRVFSSSWTRPITILLFSLSLVCPSYGQEKDYKPQFHGILRGKYEYEPGLDASRFEVRNARASVEGNLPLRACYKLEMDFCDETEIKMKDAWVGVNPWSTLRFTIGQQRLPFSIDAHRNPQEQFFANRSFIAKQVGDVRDVGLLGQYTFTHHSRPIAIVAAGIFNGSNVTSQKTAWHSDWNYSARLQLFPIDGLAIVPSVQHTAIADRAVHYTSWDIGVYYERSHWHAEAEYLRKTYSSHSFDACNACNVMVLYTMPLRREKCFLQDIRYLCRYDYMGDHSDGSGGFTDDDPSRLAITDYARHRLTVGLTLDVRNKYFPTEIRFNYEKYWYPHSGAKESERDKLVAELAIRF